MSISIILPAKNEAKSLARLLPKIRETMPTAEIIVVDDGSSDNTREVCDRTGVTTVSLPYNLGNGGAIKAGARAASGDTLVFMDADGQHSPEDIPTLLEKLDQGYDMVVGSRTFSSQASLFRWAANSIYNFLASLIVGNRVHDLTSGFRAVNAKKFSEYLHLLPNGFSYPTTITMAFFRAGYNVGYLPVVVARREGKSHINIIKDGARFFIIIFKIGTLYSPLKVFVPISMFHFVIGLGYYLYTYLSYGRFTNMSALLFIAAIIVFLIGLVSEQITSLQYSLIQNRNLAQSAKDEKE